MQQAFQRQLSKLAPDIKIVWNAVIERWQIVQIRKEIGRILTLEMNYKNMGNLKPMVIFTVQTEDGSYRNPDDTDLLHVITAVDNYKRLQTVGAEKYADEMDKVTEEKELAQKIKRNAMWQEVDKDIKAALVKKRKSFR